jgi:hypothetical protein
MVSITCPACLRMRDTCICEGYCRVCQCFTNHTTAQHEQACMEQLLCVLCGAPHGWDDPDARKCRECLVDEAEYRNDELSKQASYYTPYQGGQG